MDDITQNEMADLADGLAGGSRSWRVPFVGLKEQYSDERQKILDIVESVFSRGTFVGLSQVEEFEAALSDYLAVQHVMGVGSGTDALYIALRCLGIGEDDEVITVANSHFSTVSAILHTGAVPVLADVRNDLNMDPESAETLISPKTKALLPVHLAGRPADIDGLLRVANRHGLKIIEDAAQSIGSKYKDRLTGTLGHVAAFSAHPLKNLNAAGDAGYLTANDPDIAEKIRRFRNNGLEGRETVTGWGTVSRLDVFQAALLTMRLEMLDQVISKRRRHAQIYLNDLPELIETCPPADHEFHTYHNFVIQTDARDDLRDYLSGHGIATAIHYPTPIHLQPAARNGTLRHQDLAVTERQSARILSLPVHQYLTDDQIRYVIEKIRAFFEG